MSASEGKDDIYEGKDNIYEGKEDIYDGKDIYQGKDDIYGDKDDISEGKSTVINVQYDICVSMTFMRVRTTFVDVRTFRLLRTILHHL